LLKGIRRDGCSRKLRIEVIFDYEYIGNATLTKKYDMSMRRELFDFTRSQNNKKGMRLVPCFFYVFEFDKHSINGLIHIYIYVY